jgi:hypothetical protein
LLPFCRPNRRPAVRLMRLFSAGLLIAAGALLFSPSGHAGARHTHWGDGFSIDLDQPYDRVLDVVREVTADGTIRGTSQYKGTTELDGAIPAKTSTAFHGSDGGTALYKVRPDALSPEHFYESNDKGTVTVRYIIQSLGPKSTRLRIDAVFIEDSLRRSHASDGVPENAEFLVISDRLKDIEDRERQQRVDAATDLQQQKLSKLQDELDQERTQLKAVTARQEQVQSQIQQLQSGRPGQIRTGSADLKAAPYNSSSTLQSLAQGDTVTVLLETRSWYRVQASNGQQGWIYRLMLEVAP